MTTLQEALKKAGLVGQTTQLTEEAIDAGIEAIKNNYGGPHYELEQLCILSIPIDKQKVGEYTGIYRECEQRLLGFYTVELTLNDGGEKDHG
jgi:hypothetical protein